MATLIFLLITFVMIKQLFTPLCLSASTAGSTLTSGILDIKYYCSVLYWAAAIESLFGGLIAGKIGDGFMAGGIKHSLILLLITFVVFNVMEVI
jgi:flagellar protein FlaJ